MYRIAFFAILWTAECANYQRYVSSTQSPYSTYSTISNLYNLNPPKSTYGSDIANFPEATRYPNYNQGYTTTNYNPYSSTSGLYNGLYNTQRYGQNYGQNYYGSNYGQNYGSSYGSNYGSNYGKNNEGYSSYESPFMTGIRDYCINRSPQVGIWVDSLMGMWYGVEFIQHLAGDARVDYARSCIVVHISEPMDQTKCEFKYLKMEFHITIPYILLLCVLVSGEEVSSNSTEQNVTVKCPERYEIGNIDIREVMGKWKAVELYLHLSKEGVNTYNSCPVITIWESQEIPRTTFGPSTENQHFHVQHINAKFRQEYRHLRLLWDEAGQTTEYGLYFRNDSAGYWQVFDGQNGTLTMLPNYQQFSGSIQVLKAVSDHLVLNFCQEPKNGRPAQLYSVLFSRDPGAMARWEIESIHSMLQNKRLSVASRRMVCGSSAVRTEQSLFLYLIIFLIKKIASS